MAFFAAAGEPGSPKPSAATIRNTINPIQPKRNPDKTPPISMANLHHHQKSYGKISGEGVVVVVLVVSADLTRDEQHPSDNS